MKQDGTPVCMLTIYDCPRDFPGHVVVRRWSFKPDNPGAFSRFLDKAGETALTINMFEREMP